MSRLGLVGEISVSVRCGVSHRLRNSDLMVEGGLLRIYLISRLETATTADSVWKSASLENIAQKKMDIFTAHSLMIRPPSLLVFSVLYLALVWLAKKSLSSSQFYRLRANADLLRFKTI